MSRGIGDVFRGLAAMRKLARLQVAYNDGYDTACQKIPARVAPHSDVETYRAYQAGYADCVAGRPRQEFP